MSADTTTNTLQKMNDTTTTPMKVGTSTAISTPSNRSAATQAETPPCNRLPASQETPTVVGSQPSPLPSSSSDDDQSTTISDNDDITGLSTRVPTPARVTEELKKDPFLKQMLDLPHTSKYVSEKEKELFLSPQVWESVSHALYKALAVCAQTGKKDLKSASREYLGERHKIIKDIVGSQEFYKQCLESEVVPNDMEKLRKISCLLQLVSFRYIETYHDLISSTSNDGTVSIAEQIKEKVGHAIKCNDTNSLFHDKKVRNNVYYIIGFLGNQGKKEAERRAKGSGVKKCLLHITKERFLVPSNPKSEEKIDALRDKGVPTEMVDARLAFNGLHYPDELCWQVFAIIEFIYSTLATPDNFIWRGGKLLREICDGMLSNSDMQKLFYSLCGGDNELAGDSSEEAVKNTAEFSFEDAMLTFQYFLKVFGRVRAKDLALKYNSKTFKGNTLNTRSTVLGCANKATKKQETGADTGSDLSHLKVPELKEMCRKANLRVGGRKHELIARLKENADDTNAGDEGMSEDHHNELVENLNKLDEELDDDADDDANGKKIISPVVEEMIDEDNDE